jgi:hypothetical protein
MNMEVAPKYGARFIRVYSGNGLSILVTLISPLFAVLLSNYLNTHEKRQTTFALPVLDIDANRREVQHSEPCPELSMAKDSPSEHVPVWPALPPKSEKQALAQKLIGKADETKDNPASRFVMLRLAKDIAVQANDGQTAFQAIDAMAEFHVDADTMKTAVLSRFASAAQRPAQHKSIAEQALRLADQAAGQDHLMAASQLGKLALAEARRGLDKELLARAQGQIADVAERVKARELSSR